MKLYQFQKALKKRKVEGALFLQQGCTDLAFPYFAGVSDLERGALYIPQRGKPKLFVGWFEYERFKDKKGLRVVRANDLWKTLQQEVGMDKRIGYNGGVLPVQPFLKIKQKLNAALFDVSKEFLELRYTKTQEEIHRMKRAAEVGDDVLEACLAQFSLFKTERDVAQFLKKSILEEGCECSFEPIVASGKHGATPHYVPAGKLAKGFCVIDFGVKYKGYCSDMTRTVFIGKPTAAHQRVYAKVRSVQEECLSKVKPEISFWKLDTLAKKRFGKKAKYFVHDLGHSLGMEVHDSMPDREAFVLKKNAVVTIEPGLYFKEKFGIRIEDDVVVGGKVLTRFPKDLQVL